MILIPWSPSISTHEAKTTTWVLPNTAYSIYWMFHALLHEDLISIELGLRGSGGHTYRVRVRNDEGVPFTFRIGDQDPGFSQNHHFLSGEAIAEIVPSLPTPSDPSIFTEILPNGEWPI